MKEVPVTFKSERKQIVGMLHLPNQKNPPVIIMCHGWSGSKEGYPNYFFVKVSREFAKKGFATLRFDFRGSGDSEGKWEEQNTTTMLKDLDNAIDYLVSNSAIDKEKIGLVGHSQGGRIVLLQAASDRRVKCLVTWAARTDLSYFWSNAWLDKAKRKGYEFDGFKVSKKWLADDLKYDVEKSIRKIKVPICVIHGDMDFDVPDSEGFRIYNNSNRPKKLHIIKGATHDFSGIKIQDEVIKVTLNWFNKWLK